MKTAAKHFRFNLKWLLALVAVAAAVLSVATQIGMLHCEFVVTSNELSINDDGLVEGVLSLGFLGQEYEDQWPYQCRLANVDSRLLVDLKPNSRTTIRYRATAFGPLKKQEPCAIYLAKLGVNSDDIDGYVFLNSGTDVAINGRN